MDVQSFFQVPVTNWRAVHGGDINESFCIETKTGKYFLKVNLARHFPGMFAKEAAGLRALKRDSLFNVPEVIADGIHAEQQYLVLDWLSPVNPAKIHWEQFGSRLADLHRQSSENFGWEEDNYIGNLIQRNTPSKEWPVFYSACRLMPLVLILKGKGLMDKQDLQNAENLLEKIRRIFPPEPPALLHGDLWGGNFMMTESGPAIFDPAVYYGHREMDIGMSLLFGGFDDRFYDTYHESYPLEKNWKDRIPFTQLYPLLVHAVLFGGGYIRRCKEIIRMQ